MTFQLYVASYMTISRDVTSCRERSHTHRDAMSSQHARLRREWNAVPLKIRSVDGNLCSHEQSSCAAHERESEPPYSSMPVSASLPISRNSARIARSMWSCVSASPSSAARNAARRLALRM